MNELNHRLNLNSTYDLLERCAFQPTIAGMSEIGQIIKARLKELGKTQMWLAEVAGVSNTAVTNWIKKGSIAKENVVIVADLLGLRIEDLMSGTYALGEHAARSDLVKLDPIQRRILALYAKVDDRGKLEILAAMEEISKDVDESRRKANTGAEQKASHLDLVEPTTKARRK